jgi:hypothetical protein
MAKKLFIVLAGSLTYWVLGFLLHKLFENVTETLRFLEILITASLGPFILGLVVSLFIKSKKGWVYGGASYLLYFLWVFIFSPIFEFQFKDFAEHLATMAKIYVVLGIVSILFAAFGGFLGDLGRRRPS